ncbi:MAG: amidohydrolase family protein [Gammaproteobacteria bacterium]|nr:amidohydrolase family protein [Gammaproteobacteria bacterium]
MNSRFFPIVIALLISAIGVVAEPDLNLPDDGNGVTIINASLIDGTGSPARRTSITVQNQKIVGIGVPPLSGSQILDVKGMTVLPGLIDSHVHFQAVPGAVHRKDDASTRRELMYHHLRAHVANGVTTVLDAAIASSSLRELRDYLAKGGVGPRVMALGPTFHNPEGYMDGEALSDYWAPRWRASGTSGDVDALYREYSDIEDLVGVKVAATYGFGGPLDIYETHSPEMLAVIRQRARDHGRPIYVHVNDNRGVDIALELGARALTHLVPDDATEERLEHLLQANMHVIPTLYTVEHFVVRYQPNLLDAPMVRLTVPAVERATARDPHVWDEYVKKFTLIAAPYLPEWYAGWWGNVYFTESRVRSLVENLQEKLKMHHNAGVPIAMGTDSGGWPHMPNLFHGPTAVREMELMVEAGMTPVEVLRSATVIPAHMMGIEHLVGTIEMGKRADLIVVRGNPLEDISALREIEWVMKDGEIRRSAEWMAD